MTKLQEAKWLSEALQIMRRDKAKAREKGKVHITECRVQRMAKKEIRRLS